MTVTVKFTKLIDTAHRPKKVHPSDAGFDLVAASAIKLRDGLYEYGTGLAIQLPSQHCALLMPRSSISQTNATLANSVGLIDADYRGEIKVRFYANQAPYLVGDRIAQLVILPIPYVVLHEVDELEQTTRGTGAFGSTGK